MQSQNGLVHKSVNVRPEVWRQLRINAERSGVPIRDFLAFVVENSEPILSAEDPRSITLRKSMELNKSAAERK